MKLWRIHLVFLTFLLGSWNSSLAQETVVEGYVYEDSTDIPVTYAKVFFLGTQNGAYTDTNGYFKLTIKTKNLATDSIVANYLGFKTYKSVIQKDTANQLNIQLRSSLFLELEEMTARAGENPAWEFMRRLIAAKERNNPENLDSYSSDEYAKIRFDLNHFTDKIKRNILLRPFDYIWDNTQQTEDGVNYLPMLMTEKVSKHYFKNNPTDRKDVIVAERTTGLAGPNLIQFTEDLYLTPNIYENYVSILGKSFPSPLNDNYKSNYRFYLMDSTWNDQGKTYKIRFKPKHKRELGFVGEMYFDSASYAIKEINLRFDVMANVNFVRSYYITQKYAPVDSLHWMLSESQVVGDFTVLENSSDLTGFFGRKKALYTNYTINTELDDKHFKGVEIVTYADSAKLRGDDYWNDRPIELSKEEEVLYEDTKKVIEDPAFKIRKNLLRTIATGYIPTKPFQIGVYSLYSYNFIEESRFKLALRTDPNSTFPLDFQGHLAYGLGDEVWKYSAASSYLISRKSGTRIGGKYQFDIEELGRSFNQIAIDHSLSSLVRVGTTSARNYVEEFNGYIDQRITTGSLIRLGYFHKTLTPTADSLYQQWNGSSYDVFDRIKVAGVQATFKFSYLFDDLTGNFYDRGDFYKEYRKYPDVAIQYTYADRELFGSMYDYQKVKMSIRQKVDAKKAGYFKYTVESGKTIGEVPYPLLDFPYGNQLIFADEYSFNLMRFMEFGADEYIMVHLAHHFDGLLLDRVPLINKLKWRSFVFGKAYYGSISEANNGSTFRFPEGLSPMGQPYYEVGFGIENIFKIARMDFAWRLTPGIGEYYTFLVKPSFKVSF